MTKPEMMEELSRKYQAFVTYINGLSVEEYGYSYQNKWTAAQQLEHMVICTKPLLFVYSLEPTAIQNKFGKTDQPVRSYQEVLDDYTGKLQNGGKAPDRFLPTGSSLEQRKLLGDSLLEMIQVWHSKIENFTDEELNTFLIPHPLLGNINLREMIYNAIYHVQHHQEQTRKNLMLN